MVCSTDTVPGEARLLPPACCDMAPDRPWYFRSTTLTMMTVVECDDGLMLPVGQ